MEASARDVQGMSGTGPYTPLRGASELEEGDAMRASPSSSSRAGVMEKEHSEKRQLTVTEIAAIEEEDRALEREMRNRQRVLAGVFLAYVALGVGFYCSVEGWDPLECVVVILSIVSGVGYGHIVPQTENGMAFTAVYIFAGLTLFGVMAGKILDMIVGAEIEAMTEAVKNHMAGGNQQAQAKLQEEQAKKKRAQFIVGLVNVTVLTLGSMFYFMAVFREGPRKSMYLAAVSALKMDSLCVVDGVRCQGGSGPQLSFTVLWYVLTYTVVAHFMMSTSAFLGMESDGALHVVKHLNSQNLKAMDQDGDGQVSRSEFLRAQLIDNNIAEAEVIDQILANFDMLDQDGSGALNKTDMK